MQTRRLVRCSAVVARLSACHVLVCRNNYWKFTKSLQWNTGIRVWQFRILFMPCCLTVSRRRTCTIRTIMAKVARTRLPTVGFRSWSRFFAVSLQVTWVINPAVGCHYFPPGPQLPSQPLRGLLPISLLGEQRPMGVNSLPKTVTRHYSVAAAIWTQALLRLSPAR